MRGSQTAKSQQQVRIDALEEDVKRLTEEIAKAATGSRAEGSKNGGTQE
jgi:predicted RNA-binding Zn ribbon-like protein